MVSMKGRSRRGRIRPVGAGALQRKRRARPRPSRRAPDPAAAEVVAAPDTLVADADERIVIAEEVPPAPPSPAPAPSPSRARQAWWTWALPLVLLVIIAAGVAWFEFLREPPAPAGSQMASTETTGAATAIDLVELKRLLRRLDFTPGPDAGGLDQATRDAIRQYQHTAGLPETGEPSAALLDELRQVAAPLKPESSTP
jgi:hypothetical protein